MTLSSARPRKRTLLRPSEGDLHQRRTPEAAKDKILYDNLTPLFPTSDPHGDHPNRISARIIDLIAHARPARLIVAPQLGENHVAGDANSVTSNHPT